MFDGIELVGKIEKLSKKKAARLLIEKAFRNYIGEKLKEAIQTELAAGELRQKPHLTRFVLRSDVNSGHQAFHAASNPA